MKNYRALQLSQALGAIVLLGLLMFGSGCSMLTNEFTQTNALIAESNLQSRQAYADSLAACGDNAACQVGVTSSYFSNAGQQKFIKPETPVDYLNAGLPYVLLGTNLATGRYGGGGENHGGLTLIGDNNVLQDVASTKSADNASSIVGTPTGTTSKTTEIGTEKTDMDNKTLTFLPPEPEATEEE